MNINKRAQFDKQKTFATTQQRQALMELDLNKCLEPTLEDYELIIEQVPSDRVVVQQTFRNFSDERIVADQSDDSDWEIEMSEKSTKENEIQIKQSFPKKTLRSREPNKPTRSQLLSRPFIVHPSNLDIEELLFGDSEHFERLSDSSELSIENEPPQKLRRIKSPGARKQEASTLSPKETKNVVETLIEKLPNFVPKTSDFDSDDDSVVEICLVDNFAK